MAVDLVVNSHALAGQMVRNSERIPRRAMDTFSRRLVRLVLRWVIRAPIIALVASPLLLIAVQAQERLGGAPSPKLIACFCSLALAKVALLLLCGRYQPSSVGCEAAQHLRAA